MLSLVSSMVRREVALSYRKRAEYCMPVLFFILVSLLFPLAMAPHPALLKALGPTVLWVAVILAVLLSVGSLFHSDFYDGSLEQWVLSPYPLSLLVLLKGVTQWAMLIIPLVGVVPIMAVFFHLSWQGIIFLWITLIIGSSHLYLLGMGMAALIVGLRNSGLLLALLLLPLYIPTLIFASATVRLADQGLPLAAPLASLGALCVLSWVLAPPVTAVALRIGVAYDH
ncbi:MAG: heme exporter protein CcmB [Coxiella sp. RIFCSPHIGHO2_12_FULL_44_14]|nr:MAG: heme exporter protein CcmB [Coxiella sp. RIFCSPHIGHO2_12_FULL_44_14]